MAPADSERSQFSASHRLAETTVIVVSWLGVAVSAHACAYETEIRAEARRRGVNPEVAVAIAEAESSCRPDAIGPDGEIGLFQLGESARRGLSVSEARRPEPNIRAGVAHLAENRVAGEQDARNYFSWHNAGVREWRRLEARWSIHHPNRIYRAWYRQ